MALCRASVVMMILGVAATASAFGAQPEQGSSIAESIDSLMTDLHERRLFNGAVVVGSGDDILYERGFGLANVAEGVPFTPNTTSNGASLGKTLTAAAILMLHEDGRIDLDDPVTKYLPEFPYPEVTVRHLITHSSGLHPDNVYFMFLAPEVDTWTNEGLLEILIEHEPPLAFPPGSGFVYSGTGFNMAAILMERVAGTSYASFLRERIFDPLKMDSSFLPPAKASDWPGARTHADPSRPREAFRLRTPDTFNPHWLARDPSSNRLVLGAEFGGEDGFYLLRFDAQTGELSFDPAFGADDQPGYLDLRTQSWPHGPSGSAWGHAALFLPGPG